MTNTEYKIAFDAITDKITALQQQRKALWREMSLFSPIKIGEKVLLTCKPYKGEVEIIEAFVSAAHPPDVTRKGDPEKANFQYELVKSKKDGTASRQKFHFWGSILSMKKAENPPTPTE